MPAGTLLSRGYGPNSFTGWVSPLEPAAYRAEDDTTRLLIAFSLDPEDVAGLDSLWAGYQSGAIALDAPAAVAENTLRLSAAPNPTRGDTRLEWTQTRAGHVTLDVLDVTGRRVARLAAGLFAAGPQIARGSGSDGRDGRGSPAAPGVYFARLVTSEGVRVVRIARMR